MQIETTRRNLTVPASEQTLAFLFYEQDRVSGSPGLASHLEEMQFLPDDRTSASKNKCYSQHIRYM